MLHSYLYTYICKGTRDAIELKTIISQRKLDMVLHYLGKGFWSWWYDQNAGYLKILELTGENVDDTAIIAKTKKELQDMMNIFVATERKHGMEININKSKVVRVSRRNESSWIKVG